MDMGTASVSSSSVTGLPSSASSTSMGGMSMGGDGMTANACKISMLWNWYTVDACFISSTWQITSSGMFAGSCVGVIILVMSLAGLRKLHRHFDMRIAQSSIPEQRQLLTPPDQNSQGTDSSKTLLSARVTRLGRLSSGRPNLLQQSIRAFLHMAQFAVAYFVMLLAMYYNGYIIICILIGAFLGYFVFEWEPLARSSDAVDGSATEVTGCCG